MNQPFCWDPLFLYKSNCRSPSRPIFVHKVPLRMHSLALSMPKSPSDCFTLDRTDPSANFAIGGRTLRSFFWGPPETDLCVCVCVFLRVPLLGGFKGKPRRKTHFLGGFSGTRRRKLVKQNSLSRGPDQVGIVLQHPSPT